MPGEHGSINRDWTSPVSLLVKTGAVVVGFEENIIVVFSICFSSVTTELTGFVTCEDLTVVGNRVLVGRPVSLASVKIDEVCSIGEVTFLVILASVGPRFVGVIVSSFPVVTTADEDSEGKKGGDGVGGIGGLGGIGGVGGVNISVSVTFVPLTGFPGSSALVETLTVGFSLASVLGEETVDDVLAPFSFDTTCLVVVGSFVSSTSADRTENKYLID